MDWEVQLGRALCVPLLGASILAAAMSPSTASAAKRCFGKPVNRVIGSAGPPAALKSGDVVWLKAGATVRTAAYTRVCAGAGDQTVQAGKGRSWVMTGPGDDLIRLGRSSSRNLVQAGAGNDRVFGAKGHDTLLGGPGLDEIHGAGGNDRISDLSGDGNLLFGEEGSDRISSLGTAVSELHGGNGTDFLFSNGGIAPNGALEKLFGEKGNDRLFADRPENLGPAYLDGGEGDDWVYGTPGDDVAVFNSGIKKIQMGDGDDLMVASGRGTTAVDGGPGSDTISYEAMMPKTNPLRKLNGVRVRLVAGMSQGFSKYSLAGIENVIGSAFDDEISGVPGQPNRIWGGLGDDMILGDDSPNHYEAPYTPFRPDESLDGDRADGGLGSNRCYFFDVTQRCFEDSPGALGEDRTVVSIEDGGILTVIGSDAADTVDIGYDPAGGRYVVRVAEGASVAGRCVPDPGGPSILCPADINSLNGMMVYGGIGDDRISLDPTVPEDLTTTLDGGPGLNLIEGGPSKDFIATDGKSDPFSPVGSSGSVLRGGGNLDMIYANDAVTVDGGPGPDGLRVLDPCVGATLIGGDDPDSVVFAGARGGVKADLAGGYAEWKDSRCAAPTTIAGDVEKLEGTSADDWLIIGKRLPWQQGKSTLLGREGNNILDSRNGERNSVTTGPAGRGNTVLADPQDKVIWGWGLAAY